MLNGVSAHETIAISHKCNGSAVPLPSQSQSNRRLGCVQWKKDQEATETANLARLLWDTALLESGFQVSQPSTILRCCLESYGALTTHEVLCWLLIRGSIWLGTDLATGIIEGAYPALQPEVPSARKRRRHRCLEPCSKFVCSM